MEMGGKYGRKNAKYGGKYWGNMGDKHAVNMVE